MDRIEHAMTVRAVAHGDLRVRTAQGVEVPVAEGPLEIDFADGMAHLRWKDGAGRECNATIHPDDYGRYVVAGWIRPSMN
jgi:hypothetical protein